LRIEVSSTSLTLALLRRLPPERVEGLVMQALEKAGHEWKLAALIFLYLGVLDGVRLLTLGALFCSAHRH